MGSKASAMAERIREQGLVAIIRGNFTRQQILAIGEVLLAAGTPVMGVRRGVTG